MCFQTCIEPRLVRDDAANFLCQNNLTMCMDVFKKIKSSVQRKNEEQDIPQEPDITEEPEIPYEEEPVEDEEINEEPEIISDVAPNQDVQNILETVSSSESSYRRTDFEEFVDERLLISSDVFGTKQMKIKVLEVSDEHPPVQWRFGDRIKITKILITIRHIASQEVEEREFDIEAIERELAEKRHYTSTNRWVPTSDIKNGYVLGSRHTSLISDAVALDYIVF